MRDLDFLVISWEALANDDEMVKFVDSLSMDEANAIDKLISVGLCPAEPPYLTVKA